MPAFRPWAEMPPEVLCHIGDFLDLKRHVSARGACKAWRCALAPPSPSLLLVPSDATHCPTAASLPTRRVFELKALPAGAECVVGSSNGWLALSVGRSMFSLFNPVTATEIALPPLIHERAPRGWVSKLVFAPNPGRDDFVAAAICGMDRVAYVIAGARRWTVLDPVRLAARDRLTDVVYHGKEGRAYCLTSYGNVHVLHLPERRCREPIMDDEPSSLPRRLPRRPFIIPRRDLSAPAQSAEDGMRRRTQQQCDMIHRRSSGPDLNEPATIEPLMSLRFDPATCFALPYNKVSGFTSSKNLVFCAGNLYQVWRNSSCTVYVRLPGEGGRRRVAENEVFVLRYCPQSHPCWDVATDLGGYSLFVGRNNAASMYAQGAPGLKGNCVYWIGGRGRDQGMVFDMASGRSTPCVLPSCAGIAPQSTICWYFLSDMIMNNCNSIDGGKSDPCESPGCS